MAKRLRILHVSDLHVGKERSADGWRVERVMGEAWVRNLAEIRGDGQIDLVCFTGDLAQKGHADEYAAVREVIDALLRSVRCPRERFFCVPGNHDIDRGIAPDAWSNLRELQWHDPQGLSRWMAGGNPPFRCDPQWRDGIIQRQQAYRGVLSEIGLPHLLPGQHGNPHPHLGYRRTLDVGAGAPLHIIGFDSAWLAGDDNDAGKLRLTDDQIGRLMTGADGKPLPGWRIGLIHHPLTDLADARDAQRLLGQYGLDLLLHGHQHDPLIERWADPQTGLHVFAAGCLYEHPRYPNGLLVVDIELPEAQPLRPRQAWARKWSHRRSEWIDDDELYRGTRSGRLQLVPEPVAMFTPTPGKFIGRDDEIDQLRAALLSAARGVDTRPTVICCAIDGMPGVGKTRLAEEFITEHWLQAYPPSPDTSSGESVLRLVLVSGEDQALVRSADGLLRDLADRLKIRGTIEDVRRDLPFALQHGPNGHPRLVLIENVDSDAQAEQVAALVHGLPGCPVLVTARVRKFGGQHWKRIEVEPLPMPRAIELLREEAQAAGKGAYVPTVAQAKHLAETLGCLPLALHIAASHLGLGKTPTEFLDELRATGLDLAPAQYGDHSLQMNWARAILRSSFDISWKAWCAGAGNRHEWQQALVALAHGPVEGVGESLGAAITDLPEQHYGPCIVAAGRLSLLEWDWAGLGVARERRVRLHALIGEFLRSDQFSLDEAKVILRIGGWCSWHLQESDEKIVPVAWAALRSETAAVAYWLARAQQPPVAAAIGHGAVYALGNGPYADWLAAYARWSEGARDPALLGGLRLAEARLSEQAGDPVRSKAAAYAALAAFRDAGLELDIAITLGHIADLLRAQGEWESALRILKGEKLPIVERLGDMSSYAVTQGQIADILGLRGETDKALQIYRQLLTIHDQIGSVRELALIKSKIADVLQLQGNFDESFRIYREEVAPVFERMGDSRMHAIAQSRIADLLKVQGELTAALRIFREKQLPLYQRLGDLHSFAMTQGKIADILQMRGELEEALRIRREEELPVYARVNDVRGRAITQGKIACILLARDKFDEVLHIQREEELPVYERLGDVRLLSLGRMNLAVTLIKRGLPEDLPEVRTLLQQALADAERLRLPEAETIRGRIAQIFGPSD